MAKACNLKVEYIILNPDTSIEKEFEIYGSYDREAILAPISSNPAITEESLIFAKITEEPTPGDKGKIYSVVSVGRELLDMRAIMQSQFIDFSELRELDQDKTISEMAPEYRQRLLKSFSEAQFTRNLMQINAMMSNGIDDLYNLFHGEGSGKVYKHLYPMAILWLEGKGYDKMTWGEVLDLVQKQLDQPD